MRKNLFREIYSSDEKYSVKIYKMFIVVISEHFLDLIYAYLGNMLR